MNENNDYSECQYTDCKFLKKMFSLLGDENFSRMVDISNEYCVTEEYQKGLCDRKCSECYINFIKNESEE